MFLKMVTVTILVIYVAVAVITGTLLSKNLIDKDIATFIHTSMAIPITLVLIVYCGLSIRLEITKAKYPWFFKRIKLIDASLIVSATLLILALIFVEYML